MPGPRGFPPFPRGPGGVIAAGATERTVTATYTDQASPNALVWPMRETPATNDESEPTRVLDVLVEHAPRGFVLVAVEVHD